MAVSSILNAPDGSFVKAVRKVGSGFYTPTEGSLCTLTIALANQEALNNLHFNLVTGEETQIVIGEGDSDVRDVIDKCVMTMQCDEMSGVMFPIVDGKVVKGNNTENATFVTMEIHLMNFTRECIWDMDPRAKLQYAQQHKDTGTFLFKSDSKEAAFQRYGRAMKYLISMGPVKIIPSELVQDYANLRVQVYLNLAACQLHFENYEGVITNCSHALQGDAKNVKGLYRRGLAYSRQNDWDNAASDLREVVNLENGNKAAIRELQTVHQMLRERKDQEKLGQLARGMRTMFS